MKHDFSGQIDVEWYIKSVLMASIDIEWHVKSVFNSHLQVECIYVNGTRCKRVLAWVEWEYVMLSGMYFKALVANEH